LIIDLKLIEFLLLFFVFLLTTIYQIIKTKKSAPMHFISRKLLFVVLQRTPTCFAFYQK